MSSVRMYYCRLCDCACVVFSQVEAVRRIKGEECRYEVERIEEECVSGSVLDAFMASFLIQ